MPRIRNRTRRHASEHGDGRRWWRRGRARAGAITGQLQEERIPALTHEVAGRVESLRGEAAPLVENIIEHVPHRRRSRKSRAFRTLLVLAALAAIAVVVYVIWQRRDQEPAYLVQEPDEPMAPHQSGPDGDAEAGETANGQPPEALGSAYRAAAQPASAN